MTTISGIVDMSPTLAPFDSTILWIVIVSFIVAFFLAFGVGANDVANSFGTSVGSKVLTLRQACILATVFEILGAVALGYKVSSTIRTGMIDIDLYRGEERLLTLGYLSALLGGAIWNLTATFLSLPISGTHSIVGSIVGFSLVAKSFRSIKGWEILKIVASWFISPLLSGIISAVLFFLIRKFIINKPKSLENGLRSLPIFYGFTVLVNIFSIVHDGPHIFQYLNWWHELVITFGCGLITGLIVWYVVVPRQRNAIINKLEATPDGDKDTAILNAKNQKLQTFTSTENFELKRANGDSNSRPNSIHVNGSCKGDEESPTLKDDTNKNYIDTESGEDKKTQEEVDSTDSDKPEVAQLFSFLQILTACFGGFAHGGNDVSNAIGPLVAVWLIFMTGRYTQLGETPWYILLFGGFGISVGLWVWGRKVIKTMGEDLTKITPSSGFTIEIGAATTVLLASNIGIPISTTHCKVGSVVMVGRLKKKDSVDWSLFRNIFMAWILTVPITALCSAFIMWILMLVAL